ncbi:probable methyltransferase-like protein 24 isoform X1 [Mercenaria mercenaria]|uniref:probable methyltransferase-like protein 24 isoform X1 n=1 Tax=Mercenaria mercenaria TaxID=6596 RepID=UPI00234EF1E4|nr:probable methyltransferase-like protein 24 isoform X1 [Mercenaria mercenaria]
MHFIHRVLLYIAILIVIHFTYKISYEVGISKSCNISQREFNLYKIRQNMYLLPPDYEIDKMDNNMLYEIYWKYMNTIQIVCNMQLRLGPFQRSSGYQSCIDELPKQCLIYSFGSSFNFDFESSAWKYLGCEIHTFDPSKPIQNRWIPKYTAFHLIGLSNRNEINNNGWTMKTLTAIKDQLSQENKTVDILKLDIEGYEWKVLPELFLSKQLKYVRQILIEIHFGYIFYQKGKNRTFSETELFGDVSMQYQLKVLRQLFREGFRIFSHEPHVPSYINIKNQNIWSLNVISFLNINLI